MAAVELGEAGPVVVARSIGFFLCRELQARDIGLSIASVSSACKDAEVMRQLLAGCLMAACPRSSGAETDDPSEDVERYVHRLCSAYQTTHATPPTMRRARDAFSALGDRSSADFAERKAVEETGHDTLALRDLRAMGLPAEQLVARIAPARARALVDLFADLSAQERPYGVFSCAYVLERIALRTTRDRIDQVQRLAPDQVDITRCLRVHSSVGADASHVAELSIFVAGLPSQVRTQVCRAAYATGLTIHQQWNDGGERATIRALLDEWRWQPFVGVDVAYA